MHITLFHSDKVNVAILSCFPAIFNPIVLKTAQTPYNPIALRTAKTLISFGRSESNKG